MGDVGSQARARCLETDPKKLERRTRSDGALRSPPSASLIMFRWGKDDTAHSTMSKVPLDVNPQGECRPKSCTTCTFSLTLPFCCAQPPEKVKAVQSMLTKAHNLRSDDGSPLPTRPKSTIKTQVNEAISAERKRINNIKSSIDTDIRDEEAGKLRVQLAAESKARRAAEKKELEERQRLLLSNLQQAEETKTDDDISDEAAGRGAGWPWRRRRRRTGQRSGSGCRRRAGERSSG